jgi:hypothetical protein
MTVPSVNPFLKHLASFVSPGAPGGYITPNALNMTQEKKTIAR